MTALSWRDGVQELRRQVAVYGGDPDRVHDTGLAWRAFRSFLTVPLAGLFDRWEGDVEADTLVIQAGGPDAFPELLLARRFAVPAIPWHDGEPGEPSDDQDDDVDPDLADIVQIELRLTYLPGAVGDDDAFWTTARSGAFDAADLAEAGDVVTALVLGSPLRSHIELTNCN
jgi:hypothetical protein